MNDQLLSTNSAFICEGGDPLFRDAWAVWRAGEKHPVAFLQRKLKIGYNRAKRLNVEVSRLALIGDLRDAWASVVRSYWAGEINSESTMQARLYSEIERRSPHLRFYCCPELRIARKSYVPDMVVCDGGKVVAILELKFEPHYKASTYKKDLEKLKHLVGAESYQQIRLDPKSGCYLDEAYEVASECLAVFVNIGRGSSVRREVLEASWGDFAEHRLLVLAEPVEQVEVLLSSWKARKQ